MYNVDVKRILENKNKPTIPVTHVQEHTKEELLQEVCRKYNKSIVTESMNIDISSLKDREFLFEYHVIDMFGDDKDISLEYFLFFMENAISLYNNEMEQVKENKMANATRKVANKVTTGVRRLDQKMEGKGRSAKKNIEKIDKTLSGFVNKKIDDIINIGREDKREKIITGRVSVKLAKLLKNTIKTIVGAAGAKMVLGPVGGTIATIIGLLGAYACSKKTEVREKRRILLELETELKIVKEKIEDAKGENDKKQKYELMRTQASLEKEITRIRYNMRHY